MQDLTTGEMKPLDPKFLENVFKEIKAAPSTDPFKRLGKLNERLQQAKDSAIPERERQGGVFVVGEEIEIRGSHFRIQSLNRTGMRLQSIPRREKSC